MTLENGDRRPLQEPDTQPEKNKSPLDALNDTVAGQKTSQVLKTVTGTAVKVQHNSVIVHLLCATERLSDRLGDQLSVAITYFSFLSMIPILMVSFAAVGFALARHPTLLQDIFDRILQNVNDPMLAVTLESTISTAMQQRTAVGLVDLPAALYSGIGWMGNLREAARVRSCDVWERRPQDREKIWVKYFRDLTSLIGLLATLIITLSITPAVGFTQQLIISVLHLDSIEWLKPAWRLIGLAILTSANYLLFSWIFWRLPRHHPRHKALFRGTLIATIDFEIIEIIMTWTLLALVKSPSGAAFGSVLGLTAFFYFFARLTLFCVTWIAIAEHEDDRRTPGKTHRQRIARMN